MSFVSISSGPSWYEASEKNVIRIPMLISEPANGTTRVKFLLKKPKISRKIGVVRALLRNDVFGWWL